MNNNQTWDEAENEWHKAAIYPKRYETTGLKSLRSSSLEKDEEINALLDQEFGIGFYIPSPKQFKEAC